MRRRTMGVGARISLAFLALAGLTAVAAGAGAWGVWRLQAGHEAIAVLADIKDNVATARHQVEDEVGWQGFMFAEIGLRGYETATGRDAYNRPYFVDTKDKIYAFLDGVDTSGMTAAERAGFTELRAAWDEYFAYDETLMSWLSDDTRASQIRAMIDINSSEPGTSGGNYERLKAVTDEMAVMVHARMDVMRADMAEIRKNLLYLLGVVPAAAAVLTAVISVRARRSIMQPLTTVMRTLAGLRRGDLTARAGLRRRDEFGDLGRAIDTMAAHWHGTVSTLAGHAGSLAVAADDLSAATTQIATSAEQTSAQASAVARTASHVASSSNVATAGNREVSEGIQEISRVATETAGVAAEAVAAAETTNDTMTKLEASSRQIDDVVKEITAIAAQTNLLALNATIEAARAGEAGKGFAVVASEVKDLAQKTARATESVGQRLEAIGADTRSAAEAIAGITSTIRRISDDQTFIASAVEEQTATIAETGRSMSQAATGGDEIASNIEGVAAAATATTAVINKANGAATDLARMSSELRTIVAGFGL